MADPYSEIVRLEQRLQRELDRRFSDVDKKLESIETKVDNHISILETRQYEKSTWTVRQIITIVTGFILGGGAIGIIQFVTNVLSRR